MSKCCLGRACASAPILETWIGAGTGQRARGPRGGRAAAGGGPRERVGAHACRPPARRSLRFAARAWRRPPWGQVRGRRAPGRRVRRVGAAAATGIPPPPAGPSAPSSASAAASANAGCGAACPSLPRSEERRDGGLGCGGPRQAGGRDGAGPRRQVSRPPAPPPRRQEEEAGGRARGPLAGPGGGVEGGRSGPRRRVTSFVPKWI